MVALLQTIGLIYVVLLVMTLIPAILEVIHYCKFKTGGTKYAKPRLSVQTMYTGPKNIRVAWVYSLVPTVTIYSGMTLDITIHFFVFTLTIQVTNDDLIEDILTTKEQSNG